MSLSKTNTLSQTLNNYSVTSPDVNISTAVCDAAIDTLHKGMDAKQSRKYCSEYDSTIP